ncbi:hypothetical protein C7E12_22175, partial [Stenotrophomonas maltophilia]
MGNANAYPAVWIVRAELLRGHGIDVKVTNGRSYKTRRRGQFSYTDLGNANAYPAVWIVRA